MKKAILMLALASALAGCAGLKFQWSASYQTENLVEDLRNARSAENEP